MQTFERTKNSIKNFTLTIALNFISLLAAFVYRTYLIKLLGVEYLGLSSLFSSILNILNLANLGIGSAIVYELYKPISENDERAIKAHMNFYSIVYPVIGIIIIVIGLIVMPFLPYLAKDREVLASIPNVPIIYMFFILNSATTYFFSYKSAFISVNQKQYIVETIKSGLNIFSLIGQIVALYYTHNYILSLIIQLCFVLITNFCFWFVANKKYPVIRKVRGFLLNDAEKKELVKNVKALFAFQLSGVLGKGIESVIISTFVSIIISGYLSNYNLIIMSISTMLTAATSSIIPIVGNLHVSDSNEKQHNIYLAMFCLIAWTFGLISIIMFALLNPFIMLWVGEKYVFDNSIVFLLVFNFYLVGTQSVNRIFRNAKKLFLYGRYRPLFTALLNVIFAIALANFLGVFGVLLGGTISMLATFFWYDPYIVNKIGFNKGLSLYFIKYAIYFAVTFVFGVLCYFVVKQFTLSIVGWLIAFIIIFVAFNLYFMAFFHRTKEFKYLKDAIINNLGFLKKLK